MINKTDEALGIPKPAAAFGPLFHLQHLTARARGRCLPPVPQHTESKCCCMFCAYRCSVFPPGAFFLVPHPLIQSPFWAFVLLGSFPLYSLFPLILLLFSWKHNWDLATCLHGRPLSVKPLCFCVSITWVTLEGPASLDGNESASLSACPDVGGRDHINF